MANTATSGTLYLVATPIGNLRDISLRAIDILGSVDLIACEDTRHTRKLLNHLEITKKLVSVHEHNEIERCAEIARSLAAGHSVALVSDAGTPAISDPGFRLVEAAIHEGFDVVPVPGPAAFVSAAIASGIPTDAIFFGGFLPSRKGERRKKLAELAAIPATLVFYESPHRLASAIKDCAEVLGDRRAAICRELTKLHEEILRGSLTELAADLEDTPVRGEVVIVIDRGSGDGAVVSDSVGETLAQRVEGLIAAGMDRRAALKAAAKDAGLSRSEAYRILQAEKE